MLPLDAWGINPFSESNLTWLQVTVDGEQLSPNQQILPVAYATKADRAGWAQSATYASAAASNFYVDGHLHVDSYINTQSDISASQGAIGGAILYASQTYNGYGGFITSEYDITSESGDIIATNGDIIAGGVKNFVIDHPLQKEKKIVYACIEGPEAAVYTRGTAELINGEAWVTFEEHFELVLSPESMTVQLTPLSAESEGLAVIEKTPNGFRVKELHKGTSNYKFDYIVQGIRKGYENYRVIRNKSEYEFINNSKN